MKWKGKKINNDFKKGHALILQRMFFFNGGQNNNFLNPIFKCLKWKVFFHTYFGNTIIFLYELIILSTFPFVVFSLVSANFFYYCQ